MSRCRTRDPGAAETVSTVPAARVTTRRLYPAVQALPFTVNAVGLGFVPL